VINTVIIALINHHRLPQLMESPIPNSLHHRPARVLSKSRRLGAWVAPLALLGLLLAPPLDAQSAAAQRLWTEAARLANAGDPAAAVGELSLLTERFADDPLAPRAWLQSARLNRLIGDQNATRGAVERLLSGYPQAPQAAEGSLLDAELRLADSSSRATYEEVRTRLRRVALLFGAERYPQLAARQQALIRAAEIDLLLDDPAAAAVAALSAVEDEPPSSWTSRGLLALGQALLRSGEWLTAAEVLQQAVDNQPPEPATGAEQELRHATAWQARQLLGLIQRRLLRPIAGQDPFGRVLSFPVQGLELRAAAGVAADPSGRILLLDDRQSIAAVISPAGELLRTRPVRGADRPWWSFDGEPWVVLSETLMSALTGARIQLADPGSSRGAPLRSLAAAQRGPFGDWFVLQKSARSLLHFASKDTPPKELYATTRPQLVDLARDSRGRIYILDAAGQQVLRVGLNGQPTGTVARGNWKRPLALAVDGLGYVFVLDRGNRRVDVYDPDGQAVHSLGPQLAGGLELRNPVDLTVDGAGRLFIADSRLPQLIVVD